VHVKRALAPAVLLACFALCSSSWASSSGAAVRHAVAEQQSPVPVQTPTRELSVFLSTHRAGARPVKVTLVALYEMRCNNPGPGTLVVTLPAKERQPPHIAPSAVTLNGRAAPRVKTGPHTVSITLPLPDGISCNVIAPGKLTIVFKPAAGLGNPPAPGVYRLTVRKGGLALRTTFRIG
jgi:hypothetical protein